jgi:serine/threonine-protein kinase SRPK3
MGEKESKSSECQTNVEHSYFADEFEGYDGYREGGYHLALLGEKLNLEKFIVIQKLGWGHFSTAWLVNDKKTGKRLGLKVQKSANHYTEAALDEIKLLAELKKGNLGNTHCTHLKEHFEHKGPNGAHVCLILEALRENLLNVIKKHRFKGTPLNLVKILSLQILVAMNYIHRERHIIHTDLKPENIMLNKLSWPTIDIDSIVDLKTDVNKMKKIFKNLITNENINSTTYKQKSQREKKLNEASNLINKNYSKDINHSNVRIGSTWRLNTGSIKKYVKAKKRKVSKLHLKIVDFGNACNKHLRFTDDIQTRQYRSPEVILGYIYSIQCDIWSIACVIFELITGDFLFDPKKETKKIYSREEDHIAMMIELLGPIPNLLLRKGKFSEKFFTCYGQLRHILSLNFWPLHEVLSEKYEIPENKAILIAEFLLPMLEFVPDDRASAHDLLKHPWILSKKKHLKLIPMQLI